MYVLVSSAIEELLDYIPEAESTGNVQSSVPILVLSVHKWLGGVFLQQSSYQAQATTSAGVVERSLVVLQEGNVCGVMLQIGK